MSYLNMVESSKTYIKTTRELEKEDQSVHLDTDNITDSIFRIEYTWEFLKIERDKEKIAWLLSHSDHRIKVWHQEIGKQLKTYEDWKRGLYNRFLDTDVEIAKLKQGVHQKLSEFLTEARRIGLNTRLHPKRITEIVCKNIREKFDKRILKILLRQTGGILTIETLKRVESIERYFCNLEQKKKELKDINLTLAIGSNEAPRIGVTINGKPISALCDTGAELNLIDISLIGDNKILPTTTRARSAGGHQLEIVGRAKIPVKVRESPEIIDFIVGKNLTTKCILGTPFLKKNKVVIEFNSINEEKTGNNINEATIQLKELLEGKRENVKGVECTIDTLQGKVVCVKPYQIPQAIENKVLIAINELKEKKYIIESKSSWCNNLVPVEKPDGTVRITVNFKLLNQLVEPDKYSLPRMDTIVHGLYGKKIFSKIDLKDGFFHIPIRDEDKHKTAFRVKNKLYEWNVMPQGFINSPAIFQRYMDHALEDLIGKCCYVYVDDILVFGENEEKHEEAFKAVTERLIKNGLHVNQKKVEYKVTKAKFLGHIIEYNKISLDLEKVDSIRNLKTPKSKEEVQQFMGIVNYYRKFINNCADKSEELLKFLRKNIEFKWTEKEQTAFENLKTELISQKVLRQPGFTRGFILDTDASNSGIGAVLSQMFEDGEHPIIYLSRRLRDAELNYSITEKELLAAMWAMEQLHYYLYGRKFILRTDHKAILAYNAKGEVSSRRIERWHYRLQNYAFEVVYRKGEDQGNADTLSRCCTINQEEIKSKRYQEDEITAIIEKIHKELIHRGSKCTFQKIQELYGNITNLQRVKNVLDNCVKCKEFRPRNYPGIKFHNAFEIGEKIAIDFIGPIQNHYVITGIDYFSRKGFAKALKTRETKKIIEFLKEVNSIIKIKTLICDNAKEFSNAELKQWAKGNQTEVHYTTPYHHHSNGRVERFNRTIREGLAMSDVKGPLKVRLSTVVKVYNSVKHSGTGISPDEAMKPENWTELKKKEYEYRLEQYKSYAKPIKLQKFKVNQNVLVQKEIVEDKQKPKYEQGGTVTKIMENDTYEVLHRGKIKKKYASQLRAMPI